MMRAVHTATSKNLLARNLSEGKRSFVDYLLHVTLPDVRFLLKTHFFTFLDSRSLMSQTSLAQCWRCCIKNRLSLRRAYYVSQLNARAYLLDTILKFFMPYISLMSSIFA